MIALALAALLPKTLHADIVGGRIFIPVQVAGKSFSFLLDTGATGCSIDLTLARKLELAVGDEHTIQGVGEGKTIYAPLKDASLTVPGFADSLPMTMAVDLAPLHRFEGRDILGVVGMPFFDKGPVEIDYDDGLIRFGSLPPLPESKALPITRDGEHMLIPVSLKTQSGKSLSARVLIDTGARGTLLVCAGFEKANLLGSGAKSYPVTHVASGLGGASPGFVTRLDSLQLGPYAFSRPPVRVSTAATGLLAGSQNRDALLGYEFLRRFTVRIDTAGNRIFLLPNKHFAEPIPVDQCGLVVLNEEQGVTIAEVLPGSPGSAAGAQVGDVILAANGVKGLVEINRCFTDPGGVVILEILRDQKPRTLTINCKPQI